MLNLQGGPQPAINGVATPSLGGVITPMTHLFSVIYRDPSCGVFREIYLTSSPWSHLPGIWRCFLGQNTLDDFSWQIFITYPGDDTVDGRNPANHLGCKKTCKLWYQINWCIFSSTVSPNLLSLNIHNTSSEDI